MSNTSVVDPSVWFAQLSELVHVRNPKGDIIWANPMATTFFGWQSASTESPIPSSNIEVIQGGIQHAMENGHWTTDFHRSDSNGNDVHLESRWSTIKAEDGSLAGFFVFELDVSERRQSDANMLRAQRMESIGTLAGGVAHDINNVLGPILIGAEMIKRKIDDPWVQKKLEGIETSARRGAEIVKQVLDFSRGAEGEQIVVQIRHTLKEVVEFAGRTFSKSISIEGDFPRDLPPIIGDAAQIRQCVLNLMVNARDVMPDGGTLTISASAQALTASEAAILSPHGIEGSYAQIDVSDTGTGIPADVIDRIFEPFFTTKTRGQGTGLGLSTALSIVQGHKGFLAVSSESGKGTTFSIFLPVAASEKVVETRDTPVSESVSQGGQTILVVDDEPMMLEMNVDMLESFDYKALSAENGQIGLDQFLADPTKIDLVVTDINMPVMDGPTMIREMRRTRPDLPIIAVSGLSEQQHLQEGTGLEGIQILAKPYSTDQLLSAVAARLTTPSSGSDTEATDSTQESGDTLSDSAFDDLMDGGDW